MATTSTVPAFKAALVAALDTATTVQVSRRWPGPSTADEGIFLGDVEGDMEIASIKTGRQRRNERYRVQVICQTWRSAHTPLSADDSEDRAYALLAVVENVLADDPTVAPSVAWNEVSSFADETVPFEHGWATRLTLTVAVTARLT